MKGLKNIGTEWRKLRDSAHFHNVLMFLVFVAIATIFWFVVAMNDSITETFRVKLNITSVPDTVTFINDPPSEIHVTIRDKGTNILHSGVIKNPEINVNFTDYAHNGIFRLTGADLNAEIKSDLSGGAQVTSVSIDSLRLHYTTEPGHRVPVVVSSDLSAASGYIIAGAPVVLNKSVKVYSANGTSDTLRYVRTQNLVKHGLSKTGEFKVKLQDIPNVKIVPPAVTVRVNVEPLVHKESYAPVEVLNVPEGVNLLLFPARVPVSYYVPMSRFNDTDLKMSVIADYSDLHKSTRSKLPVRIDRHASEMINVQLKSDSVEYTIVR